LTDKLEQTGVGNSIALKVLRDNRSRTVEVRVVDVGEQVAPNHRP
jgi:2-alkenal reductase